MVLFFACIFVVSMYAIINFKEIRQMSLKYPTTSKTLLDKIASGDEISWNDVYEKYSLSL